MDWRPFELQNQLFPPHIQNNANEIMTALETKPGSATSGVRAAIRWMTVALFAFTLIAIAAREAGRGLPTLDIMFYRCWLGAAVIAIALYASGQRIIDLRPQQTTLIVVRSAVHFVAQYAWLAAVTLIPLAELFAIEFTAPLWTALFAPLFLGERLTGTRLAAAVLGFAGIVIIVGPGGMTLSAGTLYACTAAIGFAFHYLATKRLTRTEGALALLFYTHLLQAVIATFIALPTLNAPDPTTAAWVVALTVLGLVAHYALTQAFSLADAIIVAPMDFLRLPLAALVGVLLYAEPLQPFLIVGAGVIVFANFLNIWGERRSD